MIRHISIFTFKDKTENGATKEENIAAVRAYMEKMPELYPPMKNQVIACSLGGTPEQPEDAPLMFGDLVQMADYETREDAEGFPPSKAHMELVKLSDPMIKKVTAIDFEL